MAGNIIELKTIGELLGMKFFIPSYQRGYRWTEQQVKDLLNDIEEFRFRTKSITDFYCLQPLVVKENIDDKNSFLNNLPKATDIENDVLGLTRKAIAEHTKWEVIDGQQRLTTLYVLLTFFEENIPFSIDYQTRNDFTSFLHKIIHNKYLGVTNEQINISIDNIFNNLIVDHSDWDNIDYYHILQTYATINTWFYRKNVEEQIDFKETVLKRVKFIWYESVNENPIDVFTRLNIGRISLTNAELIKALFLNQSNFPDKDKNQIKLKQQEIASEWDKIEYTLQNDEFWLFLHNKHYDHPTRIGFIFDLICEQHLLGFFDNIGTDDYKTFRYFYEYFKSKSHSISYCWKIVKDFFQSFHEWYDDLELYHYVGYLINEGWKIKDLYQLWTASTTKASFIASLKEKIKEALIDKCCCDLYRQYEIDGGPAKTNCKRLLLLHNIQSIINQNKAFSLKEEYKIPIFYKFPFHLYKSEKWDVEHIDSNTTNVLEKEKDQKEWLRYALLDKDIHKDIIESIKCFLDDKPGKKSFDDLSKEIEDQTSKDDNWDDAEKDKNKIWNFVLLDAGTNRGYGNAIFPAKRRCIIGKDQGKIITIDDNLEDLIKPGAIAFVPPVTKNVFLKYYNTSIASFRTWGKTDAEAYKKNILETLVEFEVYDSSINNKAKNNE